MNVTGRRLAAVALVAATCVLAAAGCQKKNRRKSTTSKSAIFTTDNFPGNDVQDGNVADDQRAFSISGTSYSNISNVVQVFFNGDRGTAIVTYTLGTGSGLGRFVHYYDGTWTPPVSVRAVDCDLSSVSNTAAVAFLNTENHSSDDARNRDGDAIILWTANDIASTAGDGVNRNLYSTYFHSRHAGDPAHNLGFQEYAQRLSTEDDNVAGTGENMSAFGLVSDGLCGEARWGTSFNDYAWGEDTTEIVVFWLQSEDNDPAAGFQADSYWSYSRFDLAAPIDAELPLVGSTATRGPILGFGASDSGLTSEESQVFSSFISYNNNLFFKVSDDADAGSPAGYVPSATTAYGSLTAEDKITVQGVAFGLGSGTLGSVYTLHTASPSAALGDTNQCNADYAQDKGGFSGRKSSVYGSDEGLAALTIFSYELTTDPNLVFGQITSDGRLVVTEINEGAGTLVAGGSDFVDDEDADVSDSVFFFDSRISRNGDYIWVAWHENVDAGGAGLTTEDQQGVFAAQYITTRIQDDDTFPVTPAITSTLSAPFQLNTIITLAAIGQPAAGFQFQNELKYRCGFQSDPDVMHVFFEHSDTTGDMIWDSRLTADLDPAGGCTPTVGVAAWESFSLQDDQVDWALYGPRINHYDWKAFDSGDGGDVITFYEQDIDVTASTDFREFSEKNGVSGGRVEIDSATPDRQVSGFSLIYYGATEPGSDIGVFDIASGEDSDDRPHGIRHLHVMFSESQVHEADGLPDHLRTRRYSSEDLSIPFGDQFFPSAGSSFALPYYNGLPNSVDGNDPFLVTGDGEMQIHGDTAGFYFFQDNHIYYQESQGDSDSDDDVLWLNSDGVSDPILVDDDNDEEIANTITVFVTSCTCETLENSMVIWTKLYGSGGTFSERLQVRVRDGNND